MIFSLLVFLVRIAKYFFCFFLAFRCFLFFYRGFFRFLFRKKKKKGGKVYGIFHEHPFHGGGGERVLWLIVKSILSNSSKDSVQLYSYEVRNRKRIQEVISKQFGLELSFQELERLHICRIPSILLGDLILQKLILRLPFTLFTQSCFSVYLVILTMLRHGAICDVFMDTVGIHCFSYPFVKSFLGIKKVSAYIHYPIISRSMIRNVALRKQLFNNSGIVSRSRFLSFLKFLYYNYLFRICFYICGRPIFVDAVMVNSSWTLKNLNHFWRRNDESTKPQIVYPPVNVSEFISIFPNRLGNGRHKILSVGQFRPEKDHRLQLEIFNSFLSKIESPENYELVLLGGCRNEKDKKLVEGLRSFTENEDMVYIEDGKNVKFILNASFEELKMQMSESSIGLHTMKKEHFGICLIEYMAAGLVTLAHNSAGPKCDIITKKGMSVGDDGERDEFREDGMGFLATTKEEYVEKLIFMFENWGNMATIRENAREKAKSFSDENFIRKFVEFGVEKGIVREMKKKAE